MTTFCKACYAVVCKHSSTTYICGVLKGPMEHTKLFPIVNGLQRVVIDVHYYNLLFVSTFDNLLSNKISTSSIPVRPKDLNIVSPSNGPLTFVGMSSKSHFFHLWFVVEFFFWKEKWFIKWKRVQLGGTRRQNLIEKKKQQFKRLNQNHY